MSSQGSLASFVSVELDRYRAAAETGDIDSAWLALERAHILSQAALGLHLQVHWAMLTYAARYLDVREVMGQLARLLLAPIGAATGMIPAGNTGRARVRAFTPMPIPADRSRVLIKVQRS